MSAPAAELTRAERVLYHQVHPLKLATDLGTAVASLILLWHQRLGPALAVMFVPSVLVTLWLVRRADLAPIRDAAIGAYLRCHMSPAMQGVRFLGMMVAAAGAWWRAPWTIALGAAVIAVAWGRGALLDRYS